MIQEEIAPYGNPMILISYLIKWDRILLKYMGGDDSHFMTEESIAFPGCALKKSFSQSFQALPVFRRDGIPERQTRQIENAVGIYRVELR
jgi:hypothetical protein